MFIKLDREYEIKTTLGTIRDIEKRFGKGFFALVQNMSELNTDDIIKLLFVGAKKAEPQLSEENFIMACDDNIGVGELFEFLEKYLYALQYPGLTDDEVKEKMEKKLKSNQ